MIDSFHPFFLLICRKYSATDTLTCTNFYGGEKKIFTYQFYANAFAFSTKDFVKSMYTSVQTDPYP